jgi:hypothetical protein
MNPSQDWRKLFHHDPVPILFASGNKAIMYFTQRDLLGESLEPVESLWEIPQAVKILRKQQNDGSWKYPGRNAHAPTTENYNLLETFRNLGQLVEKFGVNSNHPAVKKGADYLFSCQTEEGDFRGIYGNQYAPNYSSAIMEILIKAGYEEDPRISKGMEWLLSLRQEDGGWAAPLRTCRISYKDAIRSQAPLQPDRRKPFSHLITGMVLRSFAEHSHYRTCDCAINAGQLLASRFFKPDKYVDRRNASYWESVSFPFWFTDIVSALDSLSKMDFSTDNPAIQDALERLTQQQMENGLFDLKLLKTKDKDTSYWVVLAICRIFQKFFKTRERQSYPPHIQGRRGENMP